MSIVSGNGFLNKLTGLALTKKSEGVDWIEVVELRKQYGVGKKTCKKVIANSKLIKFENKVFANTGYLEQWKQKHGIKEQKTQSKPKPTNIDKRQGKIVARNSHNKKYNYTIYMFIDKNGKVIYIGRAKNLENRLNSHGHLPKECYKQIESIHYTRFSAEDDLDLAEPYYISKYKPQYNKDFKNKRYSFKIDYLENKKWYKYDTFKIL